MYCPSCGTELVQEMSYCNRCGANLKPVLNQAGGAPPTRLVGATWAISLAVAAITLGGFAMVFTLIMALVSRGVRFTESGMLLIFSALMTILIIDWLLIRQLSRVIGKAQASGETKEKAAKRKLMDKPVAQLNAPREPPVPSVTENTTRTFEPVYRERDTQR